MKKQTTLPLFMKTWYQCWLPGSGVPKVFGFCVEEGIIISSGEMELKGKILQNNRTWFLDRKAIVSKITEINY